MAAMDAQVAMDAEALTAVRTGPADVLPGDEGADSDGLDGSQIVEEVHAVSFPVALVEAAQAGAGKFGAFEAEAVGAFGNGAVLDGAGYAIGGLGGIVRREAAGAAVFVAKMAVAEGAIDAAGGDHAGAGNGRGGGFHRADFLAFLGLGAGSSLAVMRISSEIQARSSNASAIRKEFLAPG